MFVNVKVNESLVVSGWLAPAERGPTEARTPGFQAEKNLCDLCVSAVSVAPGCRKGRPTSF